MKHFYRGLFTVWKDCFLVSVVMLENDINSSMISQMAFTAQLKDSKKCFQKAASSSHTSGAENTSQATAIRMNGTLMESFPQNILELPGKKLQTTHMDSSSEKEEKQAKNCCTLPLTEDTWWTDRLKGRLGVVEGESKHLLHSYTWSIQTVEMKWR